MWQKLMQPRGHGPQLNSSVSLSKRVSCVRSSKLILAETGHRLWARNAARFDGSGIKCYSSSRALMTGVNSWVSSEERRRLLDEEMKHFGRPGIVSYNDFVNQLIIEGNVAAARKVVEVEMPAAGIEPNNHTWECLDTPEEVLSRRRVKFLSRFAENGSDKATAAAWHFMNKLISKRQVNIFHFTTMMRLCYSSDEMRRLIDVDMKQAGVQPDEASYNTLMTQLLIEGDAASARKVVDEEMRTAGLKPNKITLEKLNQPTDSITRARNKQLYRLAKKTEGDQKKTAAWAFFNKLVSIQQSTVYQFNLMMDTCTNSNDMFRLLYVDMKRAEIKPDVVSYNILLGQLMVEGNVFSARRIVEEEMLDAGVTPNETTWRIIQEK